MSGKKRRHVRQPAARSPLKQDDVKGPTDDRHLHDAHLVGLCLKGDQEAWGELLLRHRPLVLSIAKRHGFDREAAEELFQSTCLTMLERLDLLRDHRSLSAWIATTATRKCWRMRRALGAAPGPEVPADADLAPDRVFAEQARQAALREALDEMGEPCRTLLVALFAEETAYDDLARRLGLAVGSIGVYRRRCLDRLRERLRARGWSMTEGT